MPVTLLSHILTIQVNASFASRSYPRPNCFLNLHRSLPNFHLIYISFFQLFPTIYLKILMALMTSKRVTHQWKNFEVFLSFRGEDTPALVLRVICIRLWIVMVLKPSLMINSEGEKTFLRNFSKLLKTQ